MFDITEMKGGELGALEQSLQIYLKEDLNGYELLLVSSTLSCKNEKLASFSMGTDL